MNFNILYSALIAAAFGGIFIMHLWVLDNLTLFQGILHGVFWGFPYGTAIYLTGKLINGEHQVVQDTKRNP